MGLGRPHKLVLAHRDELAELGWFEVQALGKVDGSRIVFRKLVVLVEKRSGWRDGRLLRSLPSHRLASR